MGRKKKRESSDATVRARQKVKALLRNPDYLRDYAEIKTLYDDGTINPDSLSPDADSSTFYLLADVRYRELCEKYGVDPLPYTEETDLFDQDGAYSHIPLDGGASITDANAPLIVKGLDDATLDFRDSQFTIDLRPHLRDDKYLTVEIDLTKKKEEILSTLSKVIDTYLPHMGTKQKRDTSDRKADRFLIWDDYNQLKSFARIAKKHRTGESTIRKAYYRAFQDIMGEKYNPERHNRKAVTKEQLKKTCETCSENPDRGGKCDTLCPDVLSFVMQDEVKQRELLLENGTQ